MALLVSPRTKVEGVREVCPEDVARLIVEADQSPRKRAHLLLHRDHADTIQRLLIALCPGTYFRPHHHSEQWEMLTLMQGAAEVVTFGSGEDVLGRHPMLPCSVVQVAPGVPHTLIALAPGTLVLEVKPGPFRPAEFESWAPEEYTGAARAYLDRLTGDRA